MYLQTKKKNNFVKIPKFFYIEILYCLHCSPDFASLCQQISEKNSWPPPWPNPGSATIITPMRYQLSWAGICWEGDFWSELCLFHAPLHMFISRINRAWLYKGHEDPGSRMSSVGRALEWWSGGCEFKPHWGQFLTKFILFCVTLDLSDYLTETPYRGKTQVAPATSVMVTMTSQ